jgi:hypothetical protein
MVFGGEGTREEVCGDRAAAALLLQLGQPGEAQVRASFLCSSIPRSPISFSFHR